jgi:hypothetical protein
MKRLTLRPRLSYEPLANTKWVCAPNTISRTDRLAVCQTLRARIETGGEDGHHAEQDRSERKRTPPVLPERGEPMATLSPSPEETEHDEHNSEHATDACHRCILCLCPKSSIGESETD